MMSKEKILQAVKENKPPFVALPDIHLPAQGLDLVTEFVKGLQIAASEVIKETELIALTMDQSRSVTTVIKDLKIGNIFIDQAPIYVKGDTPPDILIIEGAFGVVENGAIWIPQTELYDRLLPFICEHLIIVLDKSNLVENMHDAYDRLSTSNITAGVFIAGPSKTADIEQTLVIGAQGARSLKVWMR